MGEGYLYLCAVVPYVTFLRLLLRLPRRFTVGITAAAIRVGLWEYVNISTFFNHDQNNINSCCNNNNNNYYYYKIIIMVIKVSDRRGSIGQGEYRIGIYWLKTTFVDEALCRGDRHRIYMYLHIDSFSLYNTIVGYRLRV